MNAKDVIRASMDMSRMVLNSYISDLSDADLMKRPGPGCNHLAWQLGHLISSEANLLTMTCPDVKLDLPAGFAEQHNKETVGFDDPAKFCTKQQYVDLSEKVHAASLAALDKLSESDLDDPGPEDFRSFAPTVGAMFTLIATHPMMHAGQFVPVRRSLGKPVLI